MGGCDGKKRERERQTFEKRDWETVKRGRERERQTHVQRDRETVNVVYFKKRLDAAHTKRWSKYTTSKERERQTDIGIERQIDRL